MTVDRDTVRAYISYGWAEVLRTARLELTRNSPRATPAESALFGLPVVMTWTEGDGSEGYCCGVLTAVEEDHRGRYAVTDEGMGADTAAPGFVLRLATADEVRAWAPELRT